MQQMSQVWNFKSEKAKKRETEEEKWLKLQTKDIFTKYDKPIPFPVMWKYRSTASNDLENQASFNVSRVNVKAVNKLHNYIIVILWSSNLAAVHVCITTRLFKISLTSTAG